MKKGKKGKKISKRIQNVNTPEGLEEYKKINTYKFGYTESEILLDFGDATYTEKEMDIEVVSRLAISPKSLKNLILSLYHVGLEYEKECKKSIGFDSGKSKDEDNEETS